MEYRYGPRANSKDLPLPVSHVLPVALYPAASETGKVSFNQINKNSGHCIKYLKVEAQTADEVRPEDIVKGDQVDKVQVDKDEYRSRVDQNHPDR
jgi:DNA end-binding protein Ku